MPHIHEKIDFTVETFIVYKDRVLLRLHDKYKIWLSVGGHIELDEDPNQAAIREVSEEVGLIVHLVGTVPLSESTSENFMELLAPRFLNRHRISPGHEHITFIYFAKSDTDLISPQESEKNQECYWFSYQDLDNPQYNLMPNIKFYAKTALQELGEKT